MQSGPEVKKLFSCSTQLRIKCNLPIKIKCYQFKLFACTAVFEHEIFPAKIIKMPTIVGILIILAGKISCSTESSIKKVL